MGTRERRRREKEALRNRILDAAREMFAAEGFDAVTMRRIAQRIEYSPTAIYLHFADKTALLRELCDRDFLALARRFVRLAAVEDPVERLARSGQAYAEFGMRNPHLYRFMFMTPGLPAKADMSGLERGNPEQDAYAFLRVTVQECLDGGRLRPELEDADLVAQTVWASLHGVVALHIAKGADDWIEWRPIRRRVELAVAAMMRGLLRPEA